MARHAGESDSRSPFASLIRQARLSRSWTQEDLADVSGISRSTLIRWESGEVTEPEARQVMAAADALGIDRTELFRALGWIPGEGEADPVTEELLQLRQAVVSVLQLVDEHLGHRQRQE